MKKKAIIRGLLGAPLGLALSTMITIVISLTVGDGRYYAVVPQLIADCGTQMRAVLLQAICSMLYGAAWASASAIWEAEDWSLLRQTVTHLVVCSLCTLPIAYLLRWMEHSVAGIAGYFGIFFAIYLVIWLAQYLAMKRRIRQINSAVRRDGR